MKIKNDTNDYLVILNDNDGCNKINNKTIISNDLNIFDHQLIIKNGILNAIILNDTDGFNKINNKTILSNDLNIVNSQLIITNGNSNAIVLNEAVTNNSYFLNKTVFSDLNVINGKGIKSLGDTLNIGDSTTLANLNLTTTTYEGAITLTASRINLNANIYINGVALVNGLINGQVFNQY